MFSSESVRIFPGRSPTLARQAASLTLLQMPGVCESGSSGDSIWGEYLEGDWLKSRGIPTLYGGVLSGLTLPPQALQVLARLPD